MVPISTWGTKLALILLTHRCKTMLTNAPCNMFNSCCTSVYLYQQLLLLWVCCFFCRPPGSTAWQIHAPFCYSVPTCNIITLNCYEHVMKFCHWHISHILKLNYSDDFVFVCCSNWVPIFNWLWQRAGSRWQANWSTALPSKIYGHSDIPTTSAGSCVDAL